MKREEPKKEFEEFHVPKPLLNELKSAAQERHQTLEQYLDDLLAAILFGNWS